MTTIADEISRISTNVSDSIDAVATYGVDTTGATSNELAGLILAIPTVTVPVPIEQGGTHATTAEAARTNLGAASQAEVDDLKAQIAALLARIEELEERTTFETVTAE